jgi:hypothetical protein
VTGLLLVLPESLLNNGLSRDTSVVKSGNEQDGLAQHAVPTDQGVLDGDGKGVTNVESTRNVGRRGRDDEDTLGLDLTVGGELGLEETLLLPPIVPS